jgi:hypothetical protein
MHGVNPKPLWPITAEFEVIIEIFESGVLEHRQQLHRTVAKQRTDYDEVTFKPELIIDKSKARIDIGAAQA